MSTVTWKWCGLPSSCENTCCLLYVCTMYNVCPGWAECTYSTCTCTGCVYMYMYSALAAKCVLCKQLHHFPPHFCSPPLLLSPLLSPSSSLIPPALLFCLGSRGVVIAMIISFVYILLMWCFAPIIVWTTIILAPILIAGSEWLCLLLQAVLFS